MIHIHEFLKIRDNTGRWICRICRKVVLASDLLNDKVTFVEVRYVEQEEMSEAETMTNLSEDYVKDLREMTQFWGFDELRKIIDTLETEDNERAFDRYSERGI